MRMNFLTVAFALGLSGPAFAADPVYPAGSSVGMVPPAGMVPASGFAGFEDKASGSSILIMEMPPVAYDQVVEKFTAENLRAQGVSVTGETADVTLADNTPARLIRGTQTARGAEFRKWIMVVKGKSATALLTVQTPEGASDKLPDAAFDEALKTVAFRQPVAVEDQLAALPFTVGQMAGFRAVRVISGMGLILTEGPKDVVDDGSQPVMIVAPSIGGTMPAPAARDAFGRKAFADLKGVEGLQIAGSEVKDVGGDAVSRVWGTGSDPKSKQPMMVEQTIRFDGNRYVRTIAMARETQRAAVAPRLRTVADSIDFK